ncbi:hypothetical protein DSL64_02615 [Dyadobacter luteus]|uniref:Uncharacterized protein n=1 Tax=Dyadobacter luteus TaxID=2259619 RepID=A0A3D8YHY6_9BACT|nr:hypothetical protein [Dyadobacter luteus]REA64459.1 hypothetical protein DSL64_02615 [Dyadobacter luteus]
MFSNSLTKPLLTNLLSGAIIILLCCCHSKTVAPDPIDCTPYNAPSDAWRYPVLPGTKEWIELPDTETRFNACQIPSERLEAMSNEALLDSWLNFPFNYDIYLTNNLLKHMNNVVTTFSGLAELSTRKDRLSTVLREYTSRNPLCIQQLSDSIKKGEYSLDFGLFEALLATDGFLSQSALEDKKELVRESIRKYDRKCEAGKENYTDKSLSLLVCMKVMYQANYKPFINELKDPKQTLLIGFFQTGILYSSSEPDQPIVQTILRHSKKFSA